MKDADTILMWNSCFKEVSENVVNRSSGLGLSRQQEARTSCVP